MPEPARPLPLYQFASMSVRIHFSTADKRVENGIICLAEFDLYEDDTVFRIPFRQLADQGFAFAWPESVIHNGGADKTFTMFSGPLAEAFTAWAELAYQEVFRQFGKTVMGRSFEIRSQMEADADGNETKVRVVKEIPAEAPPVAVETPALAIAS